MTAFHTLRVVSKASDYRVYIGGELLFSTTTNTVGLPSLPELGRDDVNFFDGTHQEMAFFSPVLSEGEAMLMQSYFDSIPAS